MKKNKYLKNIAINENLKLDRALAIMSRWGFKSLVVLNNQSKYAGVLSDGDIRKSLVKGNKLSDKISLIYQKKTIFFYENDYSYNNIIKNFSKVGIDIIPIIDKDKKLKKVYFYTDLNDLKSEEIKKKKKITNTAVIIMSGGKGTRLKPFTDVLPKPLMPIKGKTLIEHIVSKFIDYDIKDFIFSINYKSHLIKAFFKELNPTYTLKYIEEKNPLGTAGSLKMIDKTNFKYFFISNCDTIIKADLYDLHKFHRSNKHDITIVVSKKKIKIPYGVCKTGKNKLLKNIVEKPELNYNVNTGFYLINSNIVDLVPKKNTVYHITDLINLSKKLKKRVGTYSIEDKHWFDFGEVSTFKKI